MKKINVPITFKEFEKRVKSDLTSLIEQKVSKKINKISPIDRFFTTNRYTTSWIIAGLIGIVLTIAGLSMLFTHKGGIVSFVLLGIGIALILIGTGMILMSKYFDSKIKKILASEFNQSNLYELYKNLFNKFDGINCHSYEKITMPSLMNAMKGSPLGQWTSDSSKVISTTPKFNLNCFQTPAFFQSQIWEKREKDEIIEMKVGLIEIELQNLKDLEELEFAFGIGFSSNFKNLDFIETENAKFNSKFTLYSNDQIKVRVLFTPYCLETILNFRIQHVERGYPTLHKWLVHKKSKKILIYMERYDSFFLDWKMDTSKINLKDTTNEIVNSIISDCYEVYASLSMAFITSLI